MTIVSNALFLSTTGQNNNPYKSKHKRQEDRNKLHHIERVGSAGAPNQYNVRKANKHLSQGHAS